MKRISIYLVVLIIGSFNKHQVYGLPVDQPEEILRTELVLEGRSPINGKPLSAQEYIVIQDQIAQNDLQVELTPEIRELIFLLRLRKAIKSLIPF